MSNQYRTVKLRDTTFFTLDFVIRKVFYEQGIRLTKVQAMDIAVNRLGEAISRAQDKKKGEVDGGGR